MLRGPFQPSGRPPHHPLLPLLRAQGSTSLVKVVNGGRLSWETPSLVTSATLPVHMTVQLEMTKFPTRNGPLATSTDGRIDKTRKRERLWWLRFVGREIRSLEPPVNLVPCPHQSITRTVAQEVFFFVPSPSYQAHCRKR